MGVDMQVLSVSVFHHHHWAERGLAEELCRIQNEKMTELCALHPDRFVPLSIVALQHPDLAAQQLEYNVKEMGHRGAMITAALDGEELAAKRFHLFWAKAEELDVVILSTLGIFVKAHHVSKVKGFSQILLATHWIRQSQLRISFTKAHSTSFPAQNRWRPWGRLFSILYEAVLIMAILAATEEGAVPRKKRLANILSSFISTPWFMVRRICIT